MILVDKIKIKESINKYLKYKYLLDLTNNIGDIQELYDRIICKVDFHHLIKQNKTYFYYLECYGINENNNEMSKKYNLNKPFYYVFDSIKFTRPVRIKTKNCHVLFINCVFFNGIDFIDVEDVTFESNEYLGLHNYGIPIFNGNIKNLTLNSDNFINFVDRNCHNIENADGNFGMDINAENIYINESHIVAEKTGYINIRAKKIEIIDSEIVGPEVYLDVDSIISKNSSIEAYDGVIIENKDEDCDIAVINKKSPIIYNGIEIPKFNDYHIRINKKLYDKVNKNVHSLKKINR